MTISFGQLPQRSGTWTWFKSLHSSKGLRIQYEEDPSTYTIYGYDGPEVCVCTIWRGDVPPTVALNGYSQAQNDADKEEFETVYKPTANQTLQSVRFDGVQRVQLEPADVAKRMRVQGFVLSCSTLATPGPPLTPGKNSLEVDWAYTVDFQGMEGIWVKDFDERDYMEMFAVLEAGTPREIFEAVTGQPWPFGGATETPIDIDIFQFGVTIYLPPDGKIPTLIADGSFVVPPFIKLRLDYYAFSETVTPYLTGMLRIWVAP